MWSYQETEEGTKRELDPIWQAFAKNPYDPNLHSRLHQRITKNADPITLRREQDLEMLEIILANGSPDEQKSMIRHMLQDSGTDVNKNDEDPLGNGDQSIVQAQSVEDFVHASLIYLCIQQLHATQIQGIDATFANACADGEVRKVQKTLASVCSTLDPPYCRQHEYQALLETRETGSRLSPLLLVVSLGSNMRWGQLYARPLDTKNLLPKIAKILLRAGASPDCKDTFGKTVVHHGAGCSATPLSLSMVDMCISAAATSGLYGKDVVLEGLNANEMNGKRGIVGGYDCDSNRRSVYIPGLKKEVWVKPEKIRLRDRDERKRKPKLVDVMDRFCNVPLFAIIQHQEVREEKHPERDDVAEYLIKHGASVHIKNALGTTPAQSTMGWSNNQSGGKVAKVIAARARADSKMLRDHRKMMAENVCANCNKFLGQAGSKCSKCKATIYCCHGCQVKHWKQGGHKQECKEIVARAAGVKLSSEHVAEKNQMSFAHGLVLGAEPCALDRYQKPEGVEVGGKFLVSIKGLGGGEPLLICDESRACQFQYKSSGPGYGQILSEVEKEHAWHGKKTFMKASFDEAGACTIYPSTACVKNKYAW